MGRNHRRRGRRLGRRGACRCGRRARWRRQGQYLREGPGRGRHHRQVGWPVLDSQQPVHGRSRHRRPQGRRAQIHGAPRLPHALSRRRREARPLRPSVRDAVGLLRQCRPGHQNPARREGPALCHGAYPWRRGDARLFRSSRRGRSQARPHHRPAELRRQARLWRRHHRQPRRLLRSQGLAGHHRHPGEQDRPRREPQRCRRRDHRRGWRAPHPRHQGRDLRLGRLHAEPRDAPELSAHAGAGRLRRSHQSGRPGQSRHRDRRQAGQYERSLAAAGDSRGSPRILLRPLGRVVPGRRLDDRRQQIRPPPLRREVRLQRAHPHPTSPGTQ